MEKQTSYRADIDGLRAVAVVSVVLGHFRLMLNGGFVGVDVFFVISGYLIARLIRNDLAAGTFSFRDFWLRRVRRLMPALAGMSLFTLVAGWWILSATDFVSLSKSLRAMILLYSNVHFMNDTGYFELAAEEKPLLHTWSLAVEEQFYLVVPGVLWFLSRRFGERGTVLVISVSLLASFVSSVLGTELFPVANFYMMPPRAWELLVGTLLAFHVPRQITAGRHIRREITAYAGLLMIMLPVFLYRKGMAFPGLSALPPVAGAAALIWAGAGVGKAPLVNRVLASKPIVFVGLISYSLYLWHWPLLLFGTQRSILALNRDQRIFLVLVSFVAAIVSWRWIETPFRTKKILPSARGLVIAAIFVFAGLFGVSALVEYFDGFPNRYSPEVLRYSESSIVDPRYRIEVEASDFPSNLTRYGKSDVRPGLLIWGDSHAMAVLPAIEAQSLKSGVTSVIATHSETAPILGYRSAARREVRERENAFSTAVIEYVRREKIHTVLLVAGWRYYLSEAENREALSQTIDRLHEAGAKVCVMRDVPVFPFDVPRALSRSVILARPLNDLSLSPEYHEKQTKLEEQVLPMLASKGVVILDPLPLLKSENDREFVLPYDAGGSLYRDNSHLSTHGALKIQPLFAPLFSEIGGK